MWQRIIRSSAGSSDSQTETDRRDHTPRRTYYRVQAWVPVRITSLAVEEVDAAVYDLATPDPLAVPYTLEGSERSALLARLRRIEEKLDLLLGAASIDAPRPLSGRDRRLIVFSGGGLSLDVDFDSAAGDFWRVEMLLPAPYSRVVRAVAEVIANPECLSTGSGFRRLALAFRHIQPSERDAVVAYSYDLQRVALRAKSSGAVVRP